MSDFFSRMAGRARGTVSTVRPATLPLFASTGAGQSIPLVTETLAETALGSATDSSALELRPLPSSALSLAASTRTERLFEPSQTVPREALPTSPVSATPAVAAPTAREAAVPPPPTPRLMPELPPTRVVAESTDAAEATPPQHPARDDERATIDQAVQAWLDAAGIRPAAAKSAPSTNAPERARSGAVEASGLEREVARPPVVRIHIGRVDLRAATPAVAAPRAPSGPARPLLSLDRFLAERSRGDR